MDEKNRLTRQLDFLAEADKMKTVYRRTMLIDCSRRETDAEHSWHFALMAATLMEYAAEPVSELRVLRMALVHDLVEIYAGDTFAYDAEGYRDKDDRERAAADKLFPMLPDEQGAEFRALWEEFDAVQTPDARFATAVDRLQPFLNNCRTKGYTWVEGNVTLNQVYERMEPVRTAMPGLWPWLEAELENAVSLGFIK